MYEYSKKSTTREEYTRILTEAFHEMSMSKDPGQALYGRVMKDIWPVFQREYDRVGDENNLRPAEMITRMEDAAIDAVGYIISRVVIGKAEAIAEYAALSASRISDRVAAMCCLQHDISPEDYRQVQRQFLMKEIVEGLHRKTEANG